MRPTYGSTNQDGKWWDGASWRSMEKDPKTQRWCITAPDMLRQMETLKSHELNGCHVDGVFKCPRCRRMHFLPDQFDLLCDGCVSAVLNHPDSPAAVLAGIAEWRAKSWDHPDVVERRAERDRLAGVGK